MSSRGHILRAGLDYPSIPPPAADLGFDIRRDAVTGEYTALVKIGKWRWSFSGPSRGDVITSIKYQIACDSRPRNHRRNSSSKRRVTATVNPT
jgi:hypothetical protein